MNKHIIIAIVASLVISAPFIYALWNFYAVNKLEIRWSKPEKFRYFYMSNDGDISVCNPLFLPADVNNIEIRLIYDKKEIGVFKTGPLLVTPNNITDVFGTFTSTSVAETQYLLLHMDGELLGEQPIRVDPNKMFVSQQMYTALLGMIPLKITKEYTGLEFMQMMKGQKSFSCEDVLPDS